MPLKESQIWNMSKIYLKVGIDLSLQTNVRSLIHKHAVVFIQYKDKVKNTKAFIYNMLKTYRFKMNFLKKTYITHAQML